MKTIRSLVKEAVSPEKVRVLFEKKSTSELLRARHNPDHSATAVASLDVLLRERGLNDQQIATFTGDPEELYVVPLSRTPSLRAAQRRPRIWRALHWGIWLACLISAICFVIIIAREEAADQSTVDKLIASGAIDTSAYEQARSLNWNTAKLNEEILAELGLPGGPRYSILFAPMVLVLIAPGLRGMFWLWPSRILLLRPFGTQKVSKALKRFVQRNLCHTGHVTTLADQHLKESALVHFWETLPKSPEEIVLRFLFLFRLVDDPRRRLFIKTAYHYRVLKRRLASRFILNLFWASSFDTIRKIRTTDQWWRRCIDLMSASSEVILVDLTVVKSGTRWELSKISGERIGFKAIFIVQESRFEVAREILAEYWPAETPPHIHVYDERGKLADPKAFANRLASVISLPRPPYVGKPANHFWYSATALLGWFPFVGLLMSLALWAKASRSGGRLRGLRLAKVTGAISLLLTALTFVPLIANQMAQPVSAMNSAVEPTRAAAFNNRYAPKPPAIAESVVQDTTAGWRLALPMGWREHMDPDSVPARLFAFGNLSECMASVVTENTAGWPETPTQVADLMRLTILKNGATAAQTKDLSEVNRDGLDWIEFRMDATVDETAIAMLYSIHLGPERVHRVSAWTSTDAFERHHQTLRALIAGFQLDDQPPPAARTAIKEEPAVK